MKSATLPSIRVEPELREQLEGVLAFGETLSEFVENSVRDSIRRRYTQTEFVARGMASLAEAKRADAYVEPDAVVAKLEVMLAKAKKGQAKKAARR